MKTIFRNICIILILPWLISVSPAMGESPRAKAVLATGNWEPYYGEKLRNGGIVTQIVRTSFQRAGYDLEVKWYPWARAMGMAKAGKYDGVLGAWYTEDRTQYFVYSRPFFRNEIVFFKRKGMDIRYKDFSDLKPYGIGVTISSGPYDLLMKTILAGNLDIVPDPANNIQKLMLKRVDLIADEKSGILYIINTRFPKWRGQVEVLGSPLQINNLHVIFSKGVPNHQQLADRFDRGLMEIIEDGTYDLLLREYGFMGNEK